MTTSRTTAQRSTARRSSTSGTVALGAVTACAALVLSACSSSGADEGSEGAVELTAMVWADASQAEKYEAAFEVFHEKNPDITVKLDWMDVGAYPDKLATMFAAGDPADVMFLNGTWMGEYASRGALADLEAYSDQIDLSKIDPAILDASRFEDTLYGLPTGSTAIGFVYNTRIVEEAGLALPDDTTWTWDDFAAFNEQITTATAGTTYGTGFYVPWTPTISIWARQHGEQLYNEDGSLGISQETLADYWRMTTDLRDAGGFAPAGSLEDSGSSTAESPLGKDFIASQIIPANTFADYNGAMNGDLALLRLPGEGQWGEKGYQVTPTLQWGMASQSDHPEEAAELIDFLTNDPDSFEARSTLLGVPINTEVAEAVSADLPEDDRTFVDFVLGLQEERLKPYYLEPAGAGEAANTLASLATELEFNRISPDEAAAQFMTQAQDALTQASS